jgi:hypothetical protein
LRFAAALVQGLGRGWRQALVGRRSDIGVDTVDDAVQIGRAQIDQPVQPHAEFGRADFCA